MGRREVHGEGNSLPFRGAMCGFLVGSILSLTALLAGCLSHPPGKPSEPSVCWTGTAAYERRVQTLSVSPEQARERLAASLRARSPDASPKLVPVGLHRCLVDDAYHFYLPVKTGDIPLSGYYVDGHSGAVEFRQVTQTLHPPP